MTQASRILEWMYSTPLPPGVQRFDELVLKGAKEALRLDDDEAERLVESRAGSIWNQFGKLIASTSEAQLYPLAKIVDHGTRRIHSTASFWSIQKHLRTRRLAARLESRPHVYRAIAAANDRLYEAMCCVACQASGASKIRLTPKGNEGGVDFYALIEVPKGYLRCTGLNRVRVVGQSKKYTSPVSVGEIRHFATSLEDVRRQSPSVMAHLPDWFGTVSCPIVGWVFGHQGFQSGARGRALMSGMMLFDSKVLAEMIVLSDTVRAWNGDSYVGARFRAVSMEVLRAAS